MSLVLDRFPLFDSHFHIFDPRYPVEKNQGELPPGFRVTDYLARLESYQLKGGALVSGSFQAFDQSYLEAALQALGPGFVGVTQLPHTVSDSEIIRLNELGVRGIRFNLRRGGSEGLQYLDSMARRVHEVAGWHVELYIESVAFSEISSQLIRLPAVSIDHLGLSRAGFDDLLRLAGQGVRVKATGFGRVDYAVPSALEKIYQENPAALLFGTDLPSTRVAVPYRDEDFMKVIETLGEEAARCVFYTNAMDFYRMPGEATQ